MQSVQAVRTYLMQLSRGYPEEWAKVIRNTAIPMGDISYGIAVLRWKEAGSPSEAYFTFASPLPPCPYVMQFRDRLSKKFGLPILTPEEVKEWEEFHRLEKASKLTQENKDLRN